MPQKKTNAKGDTVWTPVVKIIAIIGIVVLIAAIVLAVVAKTGVFEKNTVAMKVGDTEITAHEMNFAYYSAINTFYSQSYSYFGQLINTSVSLKSQQCALDSSITWYDYFLNNAKDACEDVYLLYNKAKEENFELTQESKDALEESVKSMKEAADNSKMSLKSYLVSSYGRGMNESLYREYMTRRLIASDYYNAYRDALTYTDAEITAAYEKDQNKYDYVDYYSYTVPSADKDDDEKEGEDASLSEEDIAKQIKEAVTSKAEDATAVDAFLEAVKAQKGDDEFKGDDYKHEKSAYNENDEISKWLFDSARKEGDVEVINGDSDTYTVAVFLRRFREDYNVASMRHILLNVTSVTDDDGNTSTDGEGNTVTNDAEQKKKAEDLLQKWKDNGGTEDAFAALVKDNSDDPGSVSNGGLYENFAQKYMTDEIDTWIWEDGRKAGDCEIVKTTYGYHLVYFVGYGVQKWQYDVTEDLKTAAFEEYEKGLKEAYPVTVNDDAMKYVG